jgi:extradiol dioxygenase family protein
VGDRVGQHSVRINENASSLPLALHFDPSLTFMQAPATNPALLSPFHLAFPVHDLAAARRFYGELLGCPEGRSSPEWVDFNFYGHQIVAHLAPEEVPSAAHSAVDGHAVPVRHFGIVLPMADWQAMADRLKAAGIDFVIEPYTRFKGEPGEQATMFFLDPSGNALEVKAFADIGMLFAK